MPKLATAKARTFSPKFGKPEQSFCTGCVLEKTGVGYVPGCGPSNSPIVLVGEGPWFDEQAHGEPFVGASGSMLTRILKLIGRQREQYRIDNAIRCSYGAIEKDGRQQAIVERCGYLSETLANPATRVVVPMGATALKRVLGLHGNKKVRVQDFHGTVQRDPSDSFWVVPSYHPSYLQRGATNLIGVAAFDLARAQEVVDGKYVADVERLVLDPPVDWFRAWADSYIAACAQDPYGYPLAVDIETPEGNATKGEKLTAAADDSYQIKRINFSCDPEEGLTVPYEGEYIPIINRILAAGGVKYFWFKGYDEPRLMHAQSLASDMPTRLLNLDIMWAWKALQPALPMGLGHAAPFYCRASAWKHLSESAEVTYAAIAGRRTRVVGDGVLRDLTAEGRESVFWRHQHRFHAYVLRPATDVGLAIDRPALSAFKEKLNTKASALLQTIQAHVPDAVRPMTPAQGLTKPPAPSLLHTKARATKKDGTAKKEAPDPIKAEVYAQAVVVEKLVLREVWVCKTCGRIEVLRTHCCQPGLYVRCDMCDGKGSGPFATGETCACSWCHGRGETLLTKDAVPQVVKEVASVRRWFWVEPFNPDSPLQLLALGKACKLDPGKDKKSGNDSVDRETLQRWAKETEGTPVGEALEAMLLYKAIAKVRGTYALGIERRLDVNDRVHGEFTFRPETMRLSGINPNLTNVVADKGGKDSLAAGFRLCVVARGREVAAGSEYADE